MRTVATFHSSVFNTSEEKHYFINPGCFGDDLARWLIARLRSAGATTDDQPGQEDFGWFLTFVAPQGPHTCVIALRPGAGWVIWTERRRGLLNSVLGGRGRDVAPSALMLLHGVLATAPEVTELRWHHRPDFDAGRGDRAAVDPQAP